MTIDEIVKPLIDEFGNDRLDDCVGESTVRGVLEAFQVIMALTPKDFMRNLIALLMAAVALSASAADNATLETIALSPAFKAGEFNLELGGTATLRNESRSKDDLNFGGSLGANYWFTRGFGLGIRAESEDTAHSLVDRAIARFSVRAPLWDTVAPYGFLEGGFDFEVDRWLAGAGGGLEWRPGPVLKGRLGLFGEAGLQVDPKGNGSMRGAVGIRLPF